MQARNDERLALWYDVLGRRNGDVSLGSAAASGVKDHPVS
jgi:hypothetical protein